MTQQQATFTTPKRQRRSYFTQSYLPSDFEILNSRHNFTKPDYKCRQQLTNAEKNIANFRNYPPQKHDNDDVEMMTVKLITVNHSYRHT